MGLHENLRQWWRESGEPMPSEAELRADALVRFCAHVPPKFEQHVTDQKFDAIVSQLGELTVGQDNE